jgi:hypothetical protein
VLYAGHAKSIAHIEDLVRVRLQHSLASTAE